MYCDDRTKKSHVNVTQPTAVVRHNLFALRFSLSRGLNRNVDDFSSVLLQNFAVLIIDGEVCVCHYRVTIIHIVYSLPSVATPTLETRYDRTLLLRLYRARVVVIPSICSNCNGLKRICTLSKRSLSIFPSRPNVCRPCL